MFNDLGVSLAKLEATQEVGVAFEHNKALFQLALFPESFFMTVMQQGFVGLAEDCVYFMGFASAADRDPSLLRAVPSSSLSHLSSTTAAEAARALGSAPVAGFLRGEPGVVFTNRIQAMMEFGRHSAYFAHVDKNFEFSEVRDASECLFLSMRALLTEGVREPLQLVPRKDIDFALDDDGAVPFRHASAVSASAVVAVSAPAVSTASARVSPPLSSKQKQKQAKQMEKEKEKEKIAPSTVSFATPATALAKWKRPREAETEQTDAALTTVERDDSPSPSEASLSPLLAVTTKKRNNNNDNKKKSRKSVTMAEKVDSDEESTVSHSVSASPSPAQEKASEQDSGVWQTRRIVKRENALSVAGYAMPETGRRGECNVVQQHFDEGKAMYVESWAGLKSVIRWRSIWGKSQLGLQGNTSAVVPLAEGTSHEHFIENLQCFSLTAMYMHMYHNPAITEEFTPLWARMTAHGWKKIFAKNADFDVAALSIESPCIFVYEGRDNGYSNTNKNKKKRHAPREPGVHVFASMIAVMRYVARFPYPLQSDDSLAETLRRHGWGWRGTGKSALFQVPGQQKRMPLSEVRDFLWRQPEMLFAAYFDTIGEETIRNALILPLSEALAKEEEPVSPPIENIPLAEKEQRISAIVELSRSLLRSASSRPQRRKIEEQLSAQLQGLLWRRETAEKWAKGKWWRFEFVWIPPHAMLEGDCEPKACVDYFFDLQDAARLFVANRDSVLMRLGVQEIKRVLKKNFTDLDDPRFSLEKRIEFIVSNSENPFGEHQLEKMLRLAGWKTSRGRKQATLFFPPASEKDEENNGDDNESDGSSEMEGLSQEQVVDFILAQRERRAASAAAVAKTAHAHTQAQVRTPQTAPHSDSDSESEEEEESGREGESEGDSDDSDSASPSSRSRTNSAAAAVYSPGSVEDQIYRRVCAGMNWGNVYSTLKEALGWSTAGWEGQAYVLPPWTKAKILERRREQAAQHASGSVPESAGPAKKPSNYYVDLSGFTENRDFFAETVEGKQAMLQFIKQYGLDGEGIKPRESTANDVSRSSSEKRKSQTEAKTTKLKKKEKKDSAKDLKNKENKEKDVVAVKKKGEDREEKKREKKITISLFPPLSSLTQAAEDNVAWKKKTNKLNSSPKERYTPEYQLLRMLSEQDNKKVYFSRVFSFLQQLEWESAWLGNEPLVVPSWTLRRLYDAGQEMKKKIFPQPILPELRENVDFFRQTDEGKHAMFDYLRKHGAKRCEPFPPLDNSNANDNNDTVSNVDENHENSDEREIAEKDTLSLHTRSPRRPLRHAVCPSEHALYLAENMHAHSESESEHSESENSESEAEDTHCSHSDTDALALAASLAADTEIERESEEEALRREADELRRDSLAHTLLAERAREQREKRERGAHAHVDAHHNGIAQLEHALAERRLLPAQSVVTAAEEERIREGALSDAFSLTQHDIRSGSLFALLWKQLREKLRWTSRAVSLSQTLYFKSEQDALSLTTEEQIAEAMCVRVFRSREQVERYVSVKTEMEKERERELREHAQRNQEIAAQRERERERERERVEMKENECVSESVDEKDRESESSSQEERLPRRLFASPSSSQEDALSDTRTHTETDTPTSQSMDSFVEDSPLPRTSTRADSGSHKRTRDAESKSEEELSFAQAGNPAKAARREAPFLSHTHSESESDSERTHTPHTHSEPVRVCVPSTPPAQTVAPRQQQNAQQTKAHAPTERAPSHIAHNQKDDNVSESERESLFLNRGHTLRDYLSQAHTLLHPRTGCEHETFPLPAREEESIAVLRKIYGALKSGRSAWVYLSGSVGGGKSLLAKSLVKYLQSLARPLRGNAHNGRSPSQSQREKESFSVAMMSGTGIQNVQHLYEDLREQLCVCVRSPAQSLSHTFSAAQRACSCGAQSVCVRERLRSRGRNVSLAPCALLDTSSRSPSPLSLSSASSHTNARASPVKSSPLRGPVTNRVPLTLLIVNEIDMMKKEVVQELRKIVEHEDSSLIVLCTGNTVDAFAAPAGASACFTHNLSEESAPVTIVLSPYDTEALQQIVRPRAGLVFEPKAMEMLAMKATSATYKCDVRAMLQLAQLVLQKGAEIVEKNNPQALDGPVVPIITMRMVHELLTSQENLYKSQPLAAITPVMTNVLVSLLVARIDQRTFSPYDAAHAYTAYRSIVQVPELTPIEVHKCIELLCDVGLVVKTQTQKSSKTSIRSVGIPTQYHLQIDINALLTKPDLAESHQLALRRALNSLPAAPAPVFFK